MKTFGGIQQLNQTFAAGDLASRGSIMFAESRQLQVHGPQGIVTTKLLKISDLGLALGRVTSTGHEIDLVDPRNITFLIPRRGWLDFRISDRDFRVASGQLVALRPGERRTRANATRQASFEATTLQVSIQRVIALGAASDLKMDAAFQQDMNKLSGPVGLYLSRSLPQLADDLFGLDAAALPPKVAAELGNLIDEQLCEIMGTLCSTTASRRILPAFHRVRQAEELMEAQSDDSLSMIDLAQSLGVSLRSLQLAFNELYGLGPRDTLNRIRLNKARQRLLASGGSAQVTSVALDSGFVHLSRFAQAYHRAFGERPSETLARHRR